MSALHVALNTARDAGVRWQDANQAILNYQLNAVGALMRKIQRAGAEVDVAAISTAYTAAVASLGDTTAIDAELAAAWAAWVTAIEAVEALAA